ncbi:MAG TPA: TetR/AcrR family transcriptional regulator [Thermoanaerobaculia bacterium]|nr:TetR/AcrR family transcriptional regulator [Thermoanaerobaculia bacterium]
MPTVTGNPKDVFRGTGKRERILRAAVDVFARTGYFNAKVSEIARAAGVADGTIYLYFEGKEDLLITIFREQSRAFLAGLREELGRLERPEEKIRAIVRYHLETMGADRALAVVLQVELRQSLKFISLISHEELREYIEAIRQVVEEGVRARVFREVPHRQMIANAIFGMLDELMTTWILSEKDYAPKDHAETIAEFVLRGLA